MSLVREEPTLEGPAATSASGGTMRTDRDVCYLVAFGKAVIRERLPNERNLRVHA
jgi:hypothetical protein